MSLRSKLIEPSVYIQIDENPNCDPMDGQVFQPRSAGREVMQVRSERNGVESWHDLTGMRPDGQLCPAKAYIIDDSGDGSCYLVVGGEWGLRLRDVAFQGAWDVNDSQQWGAPFLLLPGDGRDLRFAQTISMQSP